MTKPKDRQTRIDETIAACTECGGRDFPKRSDCDGCIDAVDEEIRIEEEQQTFKIEALKAKTELLQRHLKPGDLVTHTRCMGILSEHVFAEWIWSSKVKDPSGYRLSWLRGRATSQSMKYSHESWRMADDISPFNVIHINRIPVDQLDDLKDV